ncbi:MAG: heparan-alpha-glucosaminide N-acetyltransferase domain-containing protein [Candidatus Heimdallarchaeota archaeon]
MIETTVERITPSETIIQEPTPQEKKRYLGIDVFRGIAIVGMIFVNTLAEYDATPWWTKHAADFGLTYVDLIAPFFIFAIALTYKMSFTRSVEREGYLRTYIKFIRRYAALLGFGFLGSLIVAPTGISFGWAVLQAIGLAGIFTSFFILLPRWYRFGLGLVFMVAYQFIIGLTVNIDGVFISISDLGYNDGHGGFIGGFGYSAMMLLSTAIIDDFRKGDKRLILIAGATLSVVGGGLHYLWKYTGFPAYGGLSKSRVTQSYILLTVGLAAILFWVIWYVFDEKQWTKTKSYFLQPYGKNSLFLYILHPAFIFLELAIFKSTAHLALVFFLGLFNVAILWALAWILDKKKIYFII